MRTADRLRLGGDTTELYLIPGALERLADVLDARHVTRPLLVVDDQLWAGHEARLRRLLDGRRPAIAHITAAEPAKTLSQVAGIADRAGLADGVIAMGGGITGNLAGMVAHILGFGRPLIQIPTTVVAMIDAAISTRHSLNTGDGKNTIGAYHTPAAVLADPLVLASLPVPQWREGAVEAVKAALVAGGGQAGASADALTGLARPITDLDRLTHLLDLAIRLKVGLLTDDPREVGAALALHYGHTLARALETIRNHRVSHGAAVAIGMRLAARVAELLGLLAPTERGQHDAWVEAVCPPHWILSSEVAPLIELMIADPKRGHLRRPGVPLVLLDGLGAAHRTGASPVVGVDPQVVAAAFRYLT